MKKNKNRLKIVSFEQEIVTKDSAKLLCLSGQDVEKEKLHKPSVVKQTESIQSTNIKNQPNGIVKNRNKKSKKRKSDINLNSNENVNNNQKLVTLKCEKSESESNENEEIADGINSIDGNITDVEKKKVKQKKRKIEENQGESVEKSEINNEVGLENTKVKTEESIRAKKRKKHAKLLEEKRLKGELTSQQNVLNYLSKWKHCRSEWKFEKLKQIWLQQNLFDISKIPEEFWETVVEYFSGSKGFIRNVVLRDALKIIEKEESAEEKSTDEEQLLKLKRARNIVQNLQE